MRYLLFISLYFTFTFISRVELVSLQGDQEVDSSASLPLDQPVNPRARITLGFGIFPPRLLPVSSPPIFTTVGPWQRARIEAICRALITVIAAGPQTPVVTETPTTRPPINIIPISGDETLDSLSDHSSPSTRDETWRNERINLANERKDDNLTPVTRCLLARSQDPFTGVINYCTRILTLSSASNRAA